MTSFQYFVCLFAIWAQAGCLLSGLGHTVQRAQMAAQMQTRDMKKDKEVNIDLVSLCESHIN